MEYDNHLSGMRRDSLAPFAVYQLNVYAKRQSMTEKFILHLHQPLTDCTRFRYDRNKAILWQYTHIRTIAFMATVFQPAQLGEETNTRWNRNKKY